jgi:hypothetical protein
MDAESTGLFNEQAPLLIELGEEGKSELVNLQMLLVSSSMNHEYIRKAYEKTRSFDRKQQLLAKMSELKTLYFTARNKLAQNHPERLEAIESELRHQKLTVFSEQNLH